MNSDENRAPPGQFTSNRPGSRSPRDRDTLGGVCNRERFRLVEVARRFSSSFDVSFPAGSTWLDIRCGARRPSSVQRYPNSCWRTESVDSIGLSDFAAVTERRDFDSVVSRTNSGVASVDFARSIPTVR